MLHSFITHIQTLFLSLKFNSIICEYIHFCWQGRYKENSSMIWLIFFPTENGKSRSSHSSRKERTAQGNGESVEVVG